LIECNQCGACCRELILSNKVIDPVAIEYYAARGFKADGDGRIQIKIPHVCPQLTKEGGCRIHDHKPVGCRVFPEAQLKAGVITTSDLPDSCAWKNWEK